MIVVTGATGQLGHAIVQKLIKHLHTSQVGVSCRDPEKAIHLSSQGVRVRRGDFAVPDTLADAFEGATQILLVSSNARTYGGDPLAQHTAVIDAAKKAGVRRIVYTSQIASSAASAFPPAHDHALTEEMLAESGLAWTALRNGFYAQSGIMMLDEALKTGCLETTQDGKVSWTAHEDLAEAAAAILADEGRFEGPTSPLTGTEALDFGDMAAIAAEVTGKHVKRIVITDDQMREKLAGRGTPVHVTDMVLGLYTAARNGEFEDSNSLLKNLIGRAPKTMKDLMAASMNS